jgi:multiple sugar transport system permease protein
MDSWNRGVISSLEGRAWTGRIVYLLIFLILLVLAATVLIPFVYSFTAGLKNNRDIFTSGLQLFPETPLWENYTLAWNRFNLPRLFVSTVFVVVGGLVMQIGVSLLAAYSLSKLRPFGARAIMSGFLVTLMIPGIAFIVPLYIIVARLGLLNSYWGLWLPYGVNAFMIFLLKNFFDGLPPELFDAAKVDGASPLQIFFRIALPLSMPIIIVLTILTFVNLWKDFLWPYLVLLRAPDLQPITVHLYVVNENSQPPLNQQMAGYFMAMLPPLVIAIVLQRYMQKGLSVGAVKG